MPKPSKYHQNGDQNPSKIDEKSIKIEIAFLDRFLGAKGGVDYSIFRCNFATILDKKSKKGIKKNMQNSMQKNH